MSEFNAVQPWTYRKFVHKVYSEDFLGELISNSSFVTSGVVMAGVSAIIIYAALSRLMVRRLARS